MIARIYRLNEARLAVRNDPAAFARAQAELVAALEEMAQRRDTEKRPQTPSAKAQGIGKRPEKLAGTDRFCRSSGSTHG